MIHFEVSDDLGIGLDDNLETITDIKVGDIVAIERQGEKSFIMRSLNEEEINTYRGITYRVDKGKKAQTIKLTNT